MKCKKLTALIIPFIIVLSFSSLFAYTPLLSWNTKVVFADKKKPKKKTNNDKKPKQKKKTKTVYKTGNKKLDSILNNHPKTVARYGSNIFFWTKDERTKQNNDNNVIKWKDKIANNLPSGVYEKALDAYAIKTNGGFLSGSNDSKTWSALKTDKQKKNFLKYAQGKYTNPNYEQADVNANVIDYLISTAKGKDGEKKLKQMGLSSSDIKTLKGMTKPITEVDTKQKNDDDPHINNKKEAKDFISKPPDPTTISGKAAKALFDMFYTSSIGKWMLNNSPGETIFGGAIDPNQSDSANNFKPYYVIILPALSNYGSEAANKAIQSPLLELYKILMPIFITIGIAALTIVFIIFSTQAGWDQVWDPIGGRNRYIKRFIESILCAIGICCLPGLISFLLNIDAQLIGGFKGLLQSLKVSGDNGTASVSTAWEIAQHLGIDKYTIQAMRLGSMLGGEFAGVIFQLIYLLTYIGLSVYIKYFYFTRAIAFTILMVLGPIFVAFYPTVWGKFRFANWLRELLGTIFVQIIHAFTIMFMSVFMFTINSQLVAVAAKSAAKMHNWQVNNPVQNAIKNIDLFNIFKLGPKPEYSWVAFEVLVMGWIVLMLFRPVTKSICELFGISTNMLDSIHSYTGGYLKAAGATAALAGAGMVGAAATLGVGAMTGGASVLGAGLKGTHAAMTAGKGLKEGTKLAKGARMSAFKDKALASLRNSKAKGKFNPHFRDAVSKLSGAGIKSASQLAAVSLASGDGSNALAAYYIGGRIGKSAAELVNKPLKNYDLNKANPNKAQEDAKANNQPQDPKQATNASQQRYTPDRWGAPKDPTTSAILNSSQLTDKQKARAIRKLNEHRSGQKGNALAGSGSYRKKVQANALNKAVNGQYANNGAVLSAVNNASGIIENGTAYDEKQAGLNPSYNPNTASNIAKKANAIGFDYGKWSKANPQRAQESNSAYFKRANSAMNSYASDVYNATQKASIVAGAAADGVSLSPYNHTAMKQADLSASSAYAKQARGNFNVQKANGNLGDMTFEQYQQTPQYKEGFNQFRRDYREEAGAKAGAEVTNFTPQSNDPQSAFRSSQINSLQYKDSLNSQLDSLGVPDNVRDNMLNAVDSVPGKSLTSKIDTGLSGGNQRVTAVDQDLYNKLNEQRAHTFNSAGLDSTFGELQPGDFQEMYNPINDSSGNFGISSSAVSGLSHSVASMLDGSSTDPSRASRAFEDAYSLMNPSYSTLSKFGDFAEKGMESNFDDTLSVDQAADLLQSDGDQDVGGLPEGSLVLNKSNAYSWLEARTPDGEKYLVGKLAPGDSTLAGGQVVHQDMDLTNDNQIIPRYDALTHKEASPYMVQDGNRIPVSSNMPDISNLADGQRSSGKSYYDRNDYRQMPYAPSLEAAAAKDRQISYDLFGKDYSAPDIRGDEKSAVFTAINNQTGQREIISEPYKNTLWDDMQPDSQFILPLDVSDDGLSFESDTEPQLITGSSVSASEQRNLQRTMQSTFNGSRNRQRVRDFINTLMPETETNIRNLIARNPARESLTADWHTYAEE